MDGFRLALSLLSVVPVRVGTVDARTGRRAIGVAPLVGALLGAFAALLLWALTALSAPALLAGLITVGALVLATRGMHIDGLADTVDGLGCYGPPERALSVMRDGSTGPFAVAALILVLAIQVVGLSDLARAGDWAAVVLAWSVGRAAFVLCCRRGVPAARPEGLGALVAGSQPAWVVFVWWGVLAALGAFATGGAWWIGVLAVLLTGAALLVFTGHVRRRFGGITGDVLGASGELSTTAVLAVCTLA
ncbi:cobalamin-5'-phosphate synthase [Halopolyspora algeriensis]|uniref:Adenosylcobinamide-GDP ribazoletransferase n=1 Tax=Halopolyspora algeriensis TaxID=1500506 RepID=A0A368VSG6_9ACTN|nr:adenosylcobinamide-GDP ribazoletransferase [Halopolyspora algeriensis]RCW44075.1 cobalamin-5'-phosphate synthase [Halopolyspora algeriensis]TQM53426.1 cobalamin-5'-phosphate synthase [Halopolyspora algeriensis]